MPPAPKQRGLLGRIAQKIAFWRRKKPGSRYDEADLSDDGTLGSTDGLRPIAL